MPQKFVPLRHEQKDKSLFKENICDYNAAFLGEGCDANSKTTKFLRRGLRSSCYNKILFRFTITIFLFDTASLFAGKMLN
ncbi:hypothetical protein D7004_03665 [Pedobacter jejuensis]|uniref:Uncharacterized protein n=1 Tax=Pedobacter jejuensis TaxID=1268550 RepID=A0A3N0C204_9SPHI|nr:hypothetical protein D7004_03665 [Pedobacter jejuensis]